MQDMSIFDLPPAPNLYSVNHFPASRSDKEQANTGYANRRGVTDLGVICMPREITGSLFSNPGGPAWGGGGGGVGWKLCFCRNPRKEPLSLSSPRSGLVSEAVFPQHCEQSLPGEDAPLTHADLHGRLCPAVTGCNGY